MLRLILLYLIKILLLRQTIQENLLRKELLQSFQALNVPTLQMGLLFDQLLDSFIFLDVSLVLFLGFLNGESTGLLFGFKEFVESLQILFEH